MRLLKVIFLTIVELGKQAWLLPRVVAAHFRTERREPMVNKAEAERLDRLRHPSKYVGKEG